MTATIPIDDIPRHAALAKLARVLEVDDEEVAFLADVPVEDLRALRDLASDRLHEALRALPALASDRLHEADHARLSKVSAASKLIPQGLAASIGENWFGATLCARLVGIIEPDRGGQFAGKLSLGFMADITARTDPRVTTELVHHLPLDAMQGIATTLLDRGDHLTMSHFVGHVPANVVARILEAITDDAAVIRIAVYVEHMAALDPIVALLPDERVVRLVRAADREDLWVEGMHLFSQLGPKQIERVAIALVDHDESMLRAALQAFDRHDLWVQGLEVLDVLEGERLAHLATVLIELDDQLVLDAIAAFDRHGLWRQGLEILTNLEGEHIARLGSLLPRLDDAVLAAAITAFDANGLWEEGLGILDSMPGDELARMASILIDLDRDVLIAAIDAFHRFELWGQGLTLLSQLDGEKVRTIASVLVSLDDEVIDGAVAAAGASDIWEPLVQAGVAAEHLPDDVRARLAAIIENQSAELVAQFDAAADRLGHAGLRARLLPT